SLLRLRRRGRGKVEVAVDLAVRVPVASKRAADRLLHLDAHPLLELLDDGLDDLAREDPRLLVEQPLVGEDGRDQLDTGLDLLQGLPLVEELLDALPPDQLAFEDLAGPLAEELGNAVRRTVSCDSSLPPLCDPPVGSSWNRKPTRFRS